MYRVLMPIDEKKKPTGGKVYVSEPFYRELYRRTTAAAENSPGWLIQAAIYRGVLAAEPVSGRLTVDTLRAQYELQVFGRAPPRRIPLRNEGANLLPNGVLLDGRPIESEWEPDAVALAFDVAEPGEYRLEVLLRPTIHNAVGPTGFDLSVPRLARSQLELTLPPSAPPVEAPSACGAVRIEKDPPRLLADLGPADRLTVRWQEGTASGAVGPNVDAEQLVWLKAAARLAGDPHQVQAPRGRRSDSTGATGRRSAIAAVAPAGRRPADGASGAGVRAIAPPRVPLVAPVSDQVVLEATFLLGGATGVGNFRLPRIELLDARSSKRWMAVSVDPALEQEEQQKQQLEAVAVSDFLKAWGAADAKPHAAYRLPAGETDWTLSTRPHEPRSTADQTLTLSCDEDHVDLSFEAQVSTTAGYLFQHRLTAPVGLKVEDVSLLEEDVERASRWSQEADGTITVFLNDAASGPQRLLLHGRLPLQASKAWPLPQVRLEQCRLRSATIRIFRRRNVLLAIQGSGRLAAAEPPGDRTKSDLECFVEAFAWDGSQTLPITVTVTPNRPKVRVQEVVTAQQTGGFWIARLDDRLSIHGGVVDQIEVRAPQPWNGPYQTNLPGQLQVRETPGQDRRLVYRPQAAISGNLLLNITGPLELGRGERPNIPNIGVLQIERPERWFVLPGRAQGQAIRWQTRGLTPMAWPRQLPASADASAVAYKVSGRPIQAVLESGDVPRGSGVVRLADVAMNWHADGSCCGAAVFDLEPAGAGECPLHLPEGFELLQVSVEGFSVTPRVVDPQSWRFPLTSRYLPECVEVLFRGHLPKTNQIDRQSFTAPMLGNLPVRQTLWTIIGPSSWKTSEAEGVPTVSPWKQELSRLKSAAAAFESAALAHGDDPDEASRCCQLWTYRLTAARAAAQRELAAAGAGPEIANAQQEVDAVEKQRGELAKRLETAGILPKLSAPGSAADGPDEVFRRLPSVGQPAVRCSCEGRADSLRLDAQPAEGNGLFYRLAAAAALAVLTCLAVVGLLRGTLTETLRRWPHATGLVLGLAWWLWLSPSIVGLGIALASISIAARQRMIARKPHKTA